MGHFLIEEQILFVPAECQLTHLESKESINISVIASQILTKLIESHGHIVERETFFSKIIDRYGAASTNNNLNQYILNIRKQLFFLGLAGEVIQTVPGVGFTIPLSIKIIPENTEIQTHSTPVSESKKKFKFCLGKAWAILMVLIIFISIFRFFYESNSVIKWKEYPQVKATPLNSDKDCQFFTLPSGISFNSDDDFKSISKLVKLKDLTCDEGIKTRYYIYHTPINENRYRSFVLKCTGDLTRPACYSTYISLEPR